MVPCRKKGRQNMKKFFVALLFVGLAGCATARVMNRLSPGMTRDQVVKAIGQPYTTKAITDGTQILEYILYNGYTGFYEQYWVIMKEGKVIQFGRAGDFGTGRVVAY